MQRRDMRLHGLKFTQEKPAEVHQVHSGVEKHSATTFCPAELPFLLVSRPSAMSQNHSYVYDVTDHSLLDELLRAFDGGIMPLSKTYRQCGLHGLPITPAPMPAPRMLRLTILIAPRPSPRSMPDAKPSGSSGKRRPLAAATKTVDEMLVRSRSASSMPALHSRRSVRNGSVSLRSSANAFTPTSTA